MTQNHPTPGSLLGWSMKFEKTNLPFSQFDGGGIWKPELREQGEQRRAKLQFMLPLIHPFFYLWIPRQRSWSIQVPAILPTFATFQINVWFWHTRDVWPHWPWTWLVNLAWPVISAMTPLVPAAQPRVWGKFVYLVNACSRLVHMPFICRGIKPHSSGSSEWF